MEAISISPMKSSGPFSIVDPNVERRATLSFDLSRAGIHSEPFESLDELLASNPKRGIILILDDGDAITEIGALMRGGKLAVPVIAYNVAVDPSRVVSAVRNGVSDYLGWPIDAGSIMAAAERIKEFDPLDSRVLPFSKVEMANALLTPREREVLAAAAEGLVNKEIGRKLNISPRTVEIHRAHALHKVGAKNVSDAVRMLFGLRFAA